MSCIGGPCVMSCFGCRTFFYVSIVRMKGICCISNAGITGDMITIKVTILKIVLLFKFMSCLR